MRERDAPFLGCLLVIVLAVIIFAIVLAARAVGQDCVGGQCAVPVQPIEGTPTVVRVTGHHYRQQVRTNRHYPAICRVIARKDFGNGNWEADCGTGTLIYKHPGSDLAYVSSAYHVIRGGGYSSYECWFPDGQGYRATIKHADVDRDLVLLAIRKPPCAPHRLCPVAPQIGERVWSCGYGSDQGFHVTQGVVTEFYLTSSRGERAWVGATSGNVSGDSGGPILNAKGELLAVAWGASGGEAIGTYSTVLRLLYPRLCREFIEQQITYQSYCPTINGRLQRCCPQGSRLCRPTLLGSRPVCPPGTSAYRFVPGPTPYARAQPSPSVRSNGGWRPSPPGTLPPAPTASPTPPVQPAIPTAPRELSDCQEQVRALRQDVEARLDSLESSTEYTATAVQDWAKTTERLVTTTETLIERVQQLEARPQPQPISVIVEQVIAAIPPVTVVKHNTETNKEEVSPLYPGGTLRFRMHPRSNEVQ